MAEVSWRILWSPTGFGSRADKLGSILSHLRSEDHEAELYYPTYEEVKKDADDVSLVPVFQNYAFVRSTWSLALEEALRDRVGLSVVFLCHPGHRTPYEMSEGELQDVKDSFSTQLVKVAQKTKGGLEVGNTVIIRSMGVSGHILYFIPPNRAMIETGLFNQATPVPAKLSDLERL